jgi:hypothetical protein
MVKRYQRSNQKLNIEGQTHVIVCPSMYSFWLLHWYLLAMLLFVLRCTASDYFFGIFWPCYYLYSFWLLWYLQTFLMYVQLAKCTIIITNLCASGTWTFQCFIGNSINVRVFPAYIPVSSKTNVALQRRKRVIMVDWFFAVMLILKTE